MNSSARSPAETGAWRLDRDLAATVVWTALAEEAWQFAAILEDGGLRPSMGQLQTVALPTLRQCFLPL